MTTLVPSLVVGLGLALMVVAVLLRARERQEELARILELPYGEHDAGFVEHPDRLAFFEPGVAVATAALERFNLKQRVAENLERARMPFRPGEYVLISVGGSLAGAILIGLLTSQAIVAAMALVLFLWTSWIVVQAKAARRVKAFEEQMPDALSLIGSSLQAGHTFLRAIEMMVEESEAPLCEEFERVLSEVRLGDPLIDALQRMSDRLGLRDVAWIVQAIRIQQSVGGKLGDLLLTLAEFMRAREEVRREVRVLTAEGRMSARVLGLLPIAVFMVFKTINPDYMKPMQHGIGLMLLGVAGAFVLLGLFVIRRMARIDV